jgi:peptidoglycan L-alanyl-D-glutamate endopeptidase CwlK
MLITGGELYRTAEQQKIYVAEGKSETTNSNHLRRLAIDLNFIQNGKIVNDKEILLIYGDFWENLNPLNRWGGEFSTIYDPGHFERNV